MTNSTPSGARQHFIRFVPRRPYATNDPRTGVQAMPKRAGLDLSHVQLQGVLRASLAIDLDHPQALDRVREMDYPPPQLVMVKPENGHLHAVWQLAAPVTFGEHGRHKPQALFRDLQQQITCLYGADPAYGAFMVKTPFHARWRTHEGSAAPYALGDLLEAMPGGIPAQVKQMRERLAQGEGRHQTLFHTGRLWAYGQARQAKRRGTFEAWEAQVLAEFQMLNTFAQPLPTSEVRSVAYSVACWTWQHAERLNGSVLGGEKRSLVKSWDREALSPEQARARRAEGAGHVHAVRRSRTYDAITSAIGQLASQGVQRPTHAQVAVLAGVSVSTVKRFAGSGTDRASN